VTEQRTIYVRLLDEGVECWRPVQAVAVRHGTFRIVSPPPDPDVEQWEFDAGQVVACELREFADGKRCLVATHAVRSAG